MRDRGHHRAMRPFVERCEARNLLSSSALMAFGGRMHVLHSTMAGALDPAKSQGIQGNATDFLQPTGNPTSHELAREQFKATFTGTYVLGNGRYDSQSHSFVFRGAGSGSYFLHGDVQLGTVTPKDPTKPLSGLLTIFDRNINTNFVMGLDLAGDQVTGVDKFGRPTKLTYTTDVNVSAGISVESLSQGTITIKYHSRGHTARGVNSQGTASIVVQGRHYNLGSSQILANANINP